MKTISFFRSWLLVVICVCMVAPAFGARRLSEPTAVFTSENARKIQETRAENDGKEAYILACAWEKGKVYKKESEEGGYSNYFTNKKQYSKWVKVAALKGFVDAQYKMGVLLEESLTPRAGYYGSVDRVTKSDFNQGYLKEWNMKEWDLNYGDLYGENLKGALLWYQRAEAKGLVEAQCKMANFYLTGVTERKGVSQSYPPTIHYHRRTLEECKTDPLPPSLSSSVSYTFKEILKKDEQKALQLYALAAKSNLPEANYRIGVCFEQALGVPKNIKKAMAWYLKAANQGFLDAQNALVRCYEEGLAGAPDEAAAEKWREKAVLNPHALKNLRKDEE